jgi:hypothetical protein
MTCIYRIADHDAELEELSLDTLAAPQSILVGYSSD